jgi:hypothetical protein
MKAKEPVWKKYVKANADTTNSKRNNTSNNKADEKYYKRGEEYEDSEDYYGYEPLGYNESKGWPFTRDLVVFFYVLTLIDLFLMFSKTVRDLHFKVFPNCFFIGVTLLILSSMWRGWDALGFFSGPPIDLDWKRRKDDWEIEDFETKADYSSSFKNKIYCCLVIISIVFIMAYLNKKW